jgi:excisionase family DNA binding protein
MSTIPTDFPSAATPTPQDTLLAEESFRQLAGVPAGDSGRPVRIQVETEGAPAESIAIPSSALRLLKDLLAQMSQGHAVTVIPVDAELTAHQAADLLNVSPPFLMEQLEQGLIPYREVGTERRVLLKDLIAYKESIDRKRLEALDELAAQAQQLDMGY